jgi:hypothetical protein
MTKKPGGLNLKRNAGGLNLKRNAGGLNLKRNAGGLNLKRNAGGLNLKRKRGSKSRKLLVNRGKREDPIMHYYIKLIRDMYNIGLEMPVPDHVEDILNGENFADIEGHFIGLRRDLLKRKK